MSERIKPIILSYKDGREYTLEFSRESLIYADSRGFKITELADKPMLRIPELFHYAFRMHHPQLSKAQTDKILFEDLGGLSEAMCERLGELYAAPLETLMTEETDPKNSEMAVQM